MTQHEHIHFAYEISGDGSAKTLNGASISEKIKSKSLAWVHLDANAAETREWLQREVDYLDHVMLDALLAEETRPRILSDKKGMLIILRGVNLNDNSDPEDMISIRIWIDESRIISLQKRPLKAVHDIAQKLEEGTGPQNAGDFITSLSLRLMERMEPIFAELDDTLDALEEAIIDHPVAAERNAISALRKQAILFRRYIAPQKEVMSQLRNSELAWMEAHHKRRAQECWDKQMRHIEDLDAIRERAQIIKDEVAASLADKMNKNMYILSIVAAIFLPLGFITGLLGVNVGGMPGTQNDMAFWMVCAACALFVPFVALIFKWPKWI